MVPSARGQVPERHRPHAGWPGDGAPFIRASLRAFRVAEERQIIEP
jgi:hypothetical protein